MPVLLFTILLQKSSSQCFLGEVGADGHAGLPWSSITFLIKEINPGDLLLGGKKYDIFISDSAFLCPSIIWFFFGYRPEHISTTELMWLITGNIFYFASGIILAFALKDNRAFCKYLCPITTLLKIGSRFAFYKTPGDKNKCKKCQACTRARPMDINIPEYIETGGRVLPT